MAITNILRVKNLVVEALRAMGGNQHQVDVFNWIEDNTAGNYFADGLTKWLRKTRSLRHDVYEVLIWVVAIGVVACYIIKELS